MSDRLFVPRGALLLGLGAAQPERTISGATLGAPFARDAQWIEARTGIRSVRRLADGEQIADYAVSAGRAALANAGIAPESVDLVITASCSAEAGLSPGSRIAAQVAPGAGWFELNSACSGFSYALGIADSLIGTGRAEVILVVASEHMSRMLDPADLGTSIIFGDGAGAAVVGVAAAGHTGLGPVVFGSDGGQSALIECEHTPHGRLRMAGQQVFRWAVERMPDVALEACRRAGVRVTDIDVFVPHQANLRIVDAIARKIGLQHAVIADDVCESGNTSGASIPIALTQLVRRKVAKAGELALLVGFGAGLSYAGQVVELP